MDQSLESVATGVERLAFEGTRALQARRYPHWLLLLDGRLMPEEQVLHYAALVAAKTAGIGFRRFAELAGPAALPHPAAKAQSLPEYSSAAEKERLERVWAIREDGLRLMRQGMKRRREIGVITDPAARAKAEQAYRAGHRKRLAEINARLAQAGEANFYFVDSDGPGYAGYCALQRWRIADTPANRQVVEQFLPRTLTPSERAARAEIIKRFYGLNAFIDTPGAET